MGMNGKVLLYCTYQPYLPYLPTRLSHGMASTRRKEVGRWSSPRKEH